jgi:hypothetical protein
MSQPALEWATSGHVASGGTDLMGGASWPAR